MLTKKPTTVAQAIAPLEKMRTGLASVIETARATRDQAREDAAALEQKAQLAQAEINQAEKVLGGLASVVGEG